MDAETTNAGFRAMSGMIDYSIDRERLRELAQADKEGRLMVLPCRIDDTAYMVVKKLDGSYYVHIPHDGLSVFLTREEAGAALGGDVDGSGT